MAMAMASSSTFIQEPMENKIYSAPIESLPFSMINHSCKNKLLSYLNSHRIEGKLDLEHKIKINDDHVRITVTPSYCYCYCYITCNNIPFDSKCVGKSEWGKHFPSGVPLLKTRGVAVEKSSRNLYFTQETSRGHGIPGVGEVNINGNSLELSTD